MKIFSSLIGLLLFTVPFTSCNKKSDPDQLSKTDQISAAPWKYDNAGIDNNKDGTIDLSLSTLAPNLIQSCQTDNAITFRKDNSGTVDEGPSKCNPSDVQTTPFSWSFADNETALNISNNVLSLLNGKLKIVSLTATNFVLSRDTVVFNTNVSLVVSLKH